MSRSRVHIVESVNHGAGTLVCKECGEVPIAYKTSNGRKTIRCSIARTKQGLAFASIRDELLGDLCPICNSRQATCVDHCHETGKVRAGLCQQCNSGLGMFSDQQSWLLSAIEYLQKHKA